ncbi:MAG: endonuclease I family protein, partial [Eubacteriales bacterium]
HDLITTTHTKYTTYDNCKDPNIIIKTDAGSNTSSVAEFCSQANIASTWGAGKVGTWNREHVWCQSLSNGLWGESGGGSDLHHIRPVETRLNSTRGNDPYGEVTGGNALYYKDAQGNNVALAGYDKGGVFEPLDEVKGDIARIVLYVYTHYNTYSNVYGTTNGNGKSSYFGTLAITKIISAGSEDAAFEMLSAWNTLDPVDERERNRNEAVYEIQGNRNPYIDHPEYVNAIWGSSSNGGNNGGNNGNTDNGGNGGSSTDGTPFDEAMAQVATAVSREAKFLAIKRAMTLYEEMTPTEKQNHEGAYTALLLAIEDYNQQVSRVNTAATEALSNTVASVTVMAGGLAAFLYLLKQRKL